MESVTLKVPGLVLVEHELEVPLDHTRPDGEQITLFGREVAEMVRYAVGYESRAVVTFGKPIQMSDYDPESRRDVMDLAHYTRETIGRLYKVLPTAVLAAAMRPSLTTRELEGRADAIIETLRAAGANMGVTSGRGGDGAGRPLPYAATVRAAVMDQEYGASGASSSSLSTTPVRSAATPFLSCCWSFLTFSWSASTRAGNSSTRHWNVPVRSSTTAVMV